jgi:hypothetical protein
MALFMPVRRVGIAAAAIMLAVGGSLIPASSALGTTVNPASGGSAISADEFGTSNYTTVTGPAIAESAVGELALGSTTILNIPAGFRFHAGIGSLSVGGAGCDLKGTLAETATQATFTVTHASTVSGCIAMFVGLEVHPSAGAGLATGNITKTGTSSAPGGSTNYGTLTTVAGAVSELIYLTQPSASNFGGAAFGTQPVVLARDQFGNGVAGAHVTLSITPGTGPSGAHLTCSTNAPSTDASGHATYAACRIDKVGQYRLRATSGSVGTNSGAFQVKVGTATRLAFIAYPASTTKTTLASQPRVAIVDAGGNVVTTFPTVGITIAINKHADHFSCTGGLTANTVAGVATFRGCRETYLTSLYRLTAWTGFANVTGRVFAVTN